MNEHLTMIRHRQALDAARERVGNPRLTVLYYGDAYRVGEVVGQLPSGRPDFVEMGEPLPMEQHVARLESWGSR